MSGRSAHKAHQIITAKLDSKKKGPVILSWEDAQIVQDALRPAWHPTAPEELVSTAKLVHLLTEEFKNIAPDDDEKRWEPEDYAIEAVRFLGQYQYETPKLTDGGFEEIYLIYATTVMDLTSGDTREGLKAALRAAGVRFKEEA
jgi:hypothetical protein